MIKINRNSELARTIRNNIRKVAGVSSTDKTPIFVVYTRNPKRYTPQLLGTGGYWTTKTGKPIYYPNAYKWFKVYHHSTRRIEVSREWICRKYGIFNTTVIASK